MEVCIREQCGQCQPDQDLKRRKDSWIARQGQIDEFLNPSAAKLQPNLFVFAQHFRFRRVQRPIDTQMPEIIEADGNGAAALIEDRVQIDTQARDRRAFHRLCGAGR